MQNHKNRIKILLSITIVTFFATGCIIYGLNFTKYTFVNEIPRLYSVELNKSDKMTPKEVKADFDYFMNIIKNDYPYLEINQRLNGVDFLNNEDRYWLMIKNVKTKIEFAEKLKEIIRDLNCGHADLISIKDQSKTRDMYYKVYSDVVKNGGVKGTMYKPWVDTLRKKESQVLYGSLPSIVDSKDQSESAKTENQEEIYPNNIKSMVIENEKIVYIKIHTFSYFNEEIDRPIISEFIKKHTNAKALIIDIRENGGGSTDYFKNLLVEPLLKKPLSITRYNLIRTGANNKVYIEAITKANPGTVKEISELDPRKFPEAGPEVFTKFDKYISNAVTYAPKNSLGYSGNIYVLVSGRVYSASEGFASFCKDTGFATLIGQQTGGDGFGIDPALFCLPNSGIIGRYPLQYGMTPSGEASEEVKTQPDYIIDNITVMENIMMDKCIQKVIELENL